MGTDRSRPRHSIAEHQRIDASIGDSSKAASSPQTRRIRMLVIETPPVIRQALMPCERPVQIKENPMIRSEESIPKSKRKLWRRVSWMLMVAATFSATGAAGQDVIWIGRPTVADYMAYNFQKGMQDFAELRQHMAQFGAVRRRDRGGAACLLRRARFEPHGSRKQIRRTAVPKRSADCHGPRVCHE